MIPQPQVWKTRTLPIELLRHIWWEEVESNHRFWFFGPARQPCTSSSHINGNSKNQFHASTDLWKLIAEVLFNSEELSMKTSHITLRSGEELTLCRYSHAFILSSLMEFFAMLTTVVGRVGVEPTTPEGNGFTDRRVCRFSVPTHINGSYLAKLPSNPFLVRQEINL